MKTSLMNFCIPEDIEQYMAYYGMHFNRKLCDFAISRMRKKDKVSGNMVKVVPMTVSELKSVLEENKVEIDDSCIYDAMYLAAMVKADYWGSSIEDEEHLAKYIKDVLGDEDGYEGLVFCRYIGDCNAMGTVIQWDLML